ncbi:Nif3-like dinuclear metal center hexameric protein [Paraneptunicella aestuarii]|uniref:Nif3-like dinuclear metal center hexameric protein n=1 Tax=Paraneptunicella aestuarii TaxID=2831148 RepID=UPI001E3EEBD8|nr:Nif3-like dinuclear metal center hexameric protein [Paraneptunicella aestuarii]UAA37245.1 Nif3-like dinuclear metal center hexameric protein [Paraneptunicella aestuarii]
MENTKLLAYLDELLQPWLFRDYCPNGLQVEGKTDVHKVVTGVTASQALIDAAIDVQADAILVHHGYFWKGENQVITGMKRNRIRALLANDINLFAYHLPLDCHPVLGNNAQLAKLLDIEGNEPIEEGNAQSVVRRGCFVNGIDINALEQRISLQLGRKPLIEAAGKDEIHTVAWCTGGGQGYIELAAQEGIDAFITGEASEQTIHTAREMGIHFIAAGHHATERYGAKALGEHLAAELGLKVEFIDINNPV